MRKQSIGVITKTLSGSDASNVEQWWQGLAPADQISLARKLERRPSAVVARFVENEPDEEAEGLIDYYEYLVNHELTFADGRRFHVCAEHPIAREVLGRGRIPANFRCPRADPGCPMRRLLGRAPGSTVVLSFASAEEPSGELGDA